MQKPEEVSSRIQDGLRKGLGLVNEAVGGIATVLSNADSAVRTVDQGLTGNRRAGNPRDEQDVAEMVVGLVKRGRDEVVASEDPSSSEAVGHFREALSHMSRVAQPSGLSSLLPDSPVDAVRLGIHDLRGSLALGRLVTGRGNLDDVDEVAGFADDLFGRIEHARTVVTSRPNPAPAPANPAPQNPTRVERSKAPARPMDLPGCMAADETLGVMGYLWGLSRGKGDFGVLRGGKKRLEKAASGARRMKAPEIADDIEAIAAKLPEVRSREAAAALLEEIEPIADRAWDLGRKCGITAGRMRRARAKEPAAAAG
jgi:hypothetical protein